MEVFAARGRLFFHLQTAAMRISIGAARIRRFFFYNDKNDNSRDALIATNDAGLLAEANKKQLEVEPIRGDDLEILAREVMAQSPGVIERLKELLGK